VHTGSFSLQLRKRSPGIGMTLEQFKPVARCAQPPAANACQRSIVPPAPRQKAAHQAAAPDRPRMATLQIAGPAAEAAGRLAILQEQQRVLVGHARG